MKQESPIRTTVRLITGLAIAMLAMAAALPCLASEVAVLKNGFEITHQRKAVIGDITRLYVSADGASFVDVPTAQIDHFEAAPDPPSSQNPPLKPATGLNGAPNTSPTPAGFPARPAANLNDVVNEASDRYRLDPDLVNSVIKAESGFNVRAVSPKGAQGLMQLMPGTAAQLGVPNAFDAQQNVEGGTRYLRELLERYNFDLVKALAAYNAGPQRVEQFGGVPPYYETRAYVARIVRDFNKKKTAAQKAAHPSPKTAVSQKTNPKPAGKSQNATLQAQAGASKPAQ
jgi:soluble lytic murein transglycosylase-like protein